MITRRSLLAALLALAGCDYIPFAGGRLEGETAAVPADWGALPDVVRLETRPADPYSVKLWIIGLGPAAYVHAGANRTDWVQHIEADPRVRLLVQDALYELRAERVTDAEEFATFSAAYEAKYGNPPRNPDVTEAYLFRLEPRDEASAG